MLETLVSSIPKASLRNKDSKDSLWNGEMASLWRNNNGTPHLGEMAQPLSEMASHLGKMACYLGEMAHLPAGEAMARRE
jgi:hypothetical protein